MDSPLRDHLFRREYKSKICVTSFVQIAILRSEELFWTFEKLITCMTKVEKGVLETSISLGCYIWPAIQGFEGYLRVFEILNNIAEWQIHQDIIEKDSAGPFKFVDLSQTRCFHRSLSSAIPFQVVIEYILKSWIFL